MSDDIEPNCDICMNGEAKYTGDMGKKCLYNQPALNSCQPASALKRQSNAWVALEWCIIILFCVKSFECTYFYESILGKVLDL